MEEALFFFDNRHVKYPASQQRAELKPAVRRERRRFGKALSGVKLSEVPPVLTLTRSQKLLRRMKLLADSLQSLTLFMSSDFN